MHNGGGESDGSMHFLDFLPRSSIETRGAFSYDPRDPGSAIIYDPKTSFASAKCRRVC